MYIIDMADQIKDFKRNHMDLKKMYIYTYIVIHNNHVMAS